MADTPEPFARSFTQQEALPDEALRRATEVISTGRLHRYGASAGEIPAASELEAVYADWQGATYCLATASGGQAMQIALRAVGVKAGDPVLTNAFTLAPVPGAIAALGARPVLVETDENLTIDLVDFANKAALSGARVLLISHMRGHIADMDQILRICEGDDLVLIEDCAHTMGARFDGTRSGNHGRVACFSTQTYKHINSGEGGLLTTNDAELAARATILSGSYMNYMRHGAGPGEAAFNDARLDMPNNSARMDNLRAALLIPQIADIDDNVRRWNLRHDRLRDGLSGLNHVALPDPHPKALRVGSSFQFRLPGTTDERCRQIVAEALALGVELKWFGDSTPVGFTSQHSSWRYVSRHDLPQTDHVLATLFDMRVPLTFSEADCDQIGEVLRYVLRR